jgi:hypothetical protein
VFFFSHRWRIQRENKTFPPIETAASIKALKRFKLFFLSSGLLIEFRAGGRGAESRMALMNVKIYLIDLKAFRVKNLIGHFRVGFAVNPSGKSLMSFH